MDRASPRQRLESFLKTLGEPNGAKGALPRAREIEQEEKTLIWSSASEAKLNLASFTKKLQGGAVRDAARQEIKQLLKENDIQITGDIKKALPSRLSAGDAARLSQLISPSSMPLLINDVASLKPHLQHEIRKLMDTVREGKDAPLADFLIKNTGPVHKSLVALIQPSMADHAENIASEAYEAFATALMFGRTIDDAMDRAYQRSNASYEDIKPSKELFEVATCLPIYWMRKWAKRGAVKKHSQTLKPLLMMGKKPSCPH